MQARDYTVLSLAELGMVPLGDGIECQDYAQALLPGRTGETFCFYQNRLNWYRLVCMLTNENCRNHQEKNS